MCAHLKKHTNFGRQKCKTNFNKETGFSFKALYEIGLNMAYSTHNCPRFKNNLVSHTGIFGAEFMFKPGVKAEKYEMKSSTSVIHVNPS